MSRFLLVFRWTQTNLWWLSLPLLGLLWVGSWLLGPTTLVTITSCGAIAVAWMLIGLISLGALSAVVWVVATEDRQPWYQVREAVRSERRHG